MTPSELKLFTRFPTCTQCDPDYPDILELDTALRKERGRSVMMKMGNRIRIGSKAIGPMEAVIIDENPETGNTIWKALRSEEIRTGGMRIWATLRGLRGRGALANVSFDF